MAIGRPRKASRTAAWWRPSFAIIIIVIAIGSSFIPSRRRPPLAAVVVHGFVRSPSAAAAAASTIASSFRPPPMWKRPPQSSSSSSTAVVSGRIMSMEEEEEEYPPLLPLFRGGIPPYLAIVTEPDACASVERVEETVRAIDRATSASSMSSEEEEDQEDGGNVVDLVVVRVTRGDGDSGGKGEDEFAILKMELLQKLAEMKQRRQRTTRNFALVVNDDVDIVIEALSRNLAVDGLHVKERDARNIPSIRSRLERAAAAATATTRRSSLEQNEDDGNDGSSRYDSIIVGTSCHSIESAKESCQLTTRGPDYLFVGTCYLTPSHPEKTSADQLEGPRLPGKVKRELHRMYCDNENHIDDDDDDDGGEKDSNPPDDEHTIISQSTSSLLSAPSSRPRQRQQWPPVIFAIGGIDEHNCHEPVLTHGADGVATIGAVMRASDPGEAARGMKRAMKKKKKLVARTAYTTWII